MDVGTNKTRKDTRAVVELVARYRSPSTFEYVEEACCDVSLGGMFIRSKDPAAAGTLLKLECESGVGEHIRGVARVVWLRAQQNEYGPSGMGVKFVKLDPESRDLITRLVQELAEAGIEAPSMASAAPEQRGKPPSKRPSAPTPAAAEPPPPPKAAEISATRPLSGGSPRNDVAVLHRASDRAAGAPPPPPPSSSKPSGMPGVSSRPAPSNALLAHAHVEPLEIEPSSSGSALAPLQELGRNLAPPQEVGRDLAPLQAMVRSSRVSSAPPPEERSGRAFWLVAGAVVALGAIVALLSMRAARETGPDEPQANGGSTPGAIAPEPTSMNRNPTPSQAPGAEGASALADGPDSPDRPTEPQDQGAELAAQQGAQAEAPAEQFADPEQVAADQPAAQGDVAQVPVAAAAEPSAQLAQPAAASEGAAAPPTNARPTTNDAQPSAAAPTQPSAASSTAAPAQATARPSTGASQPSVAAPPPAPARPSLADVPPVVRIVPNDQAPNAPQPSAASTSAPPSAASSNTAPAAPASAPTQAAAPSSTTAAATTQAKAAPPALPPGELARVITFTSRPGGASVFVGDQTVTTPGELNLGAMPARIRVTAQKEGFESSTVWINNVTEFQKVGGVMRREVHFVLRALPAAAAAQPQAAPAQPNTAIAQPPAATTNPPAPTEVPPPAP